MKNPKAYTLFLALITTAVVVTSMSCEKQRFDISDRTYGVQCYWTGGPNDFSPKVTFNANGTISHRDDTTSGISGTWTSSEQTVVWTLENPPKNTRFRGNFDSKRLDGSIEDDLGAKAIFQGLRE